MWRCLYHSPFGLEGACLLALGCLGACEAAPENSTVVGPLMVALGIGNALLLILLLLASLDERPLQNYVNISR